mmetsp:Transcript_8590/g.11871  ORF Transcript_8590/g.11871 Transcript_8590/m.11871 type:complete len:96 (+) Transcript_8590:2185-2472(+)
MPLVGKFPIRNSRDEEVNDQEMNEEQRNEEGEQERHPPSQQLEIKDGEKSASKLGGDATNPEQEARGSTGLVMQRQETFGPPVIFQSRAKDLLTV